MPRDHRAAARRAPADRGFPSQVPLVLDRSALVLDGGKLLIGGDPPRVMRLSVDGCETIKTLQRMGVGEAPAAGLLARHLTDVGLMHPNPRCCVDVASRVTVVVPVFDRPVELRRCLAALDGAASGLEVVVVDDGSRDAQTLSEICVEFQAKLIRLDHNCGPAAARNAGIERAERELIAFVDSDCLPQEGWLDRLAGHFADPMVAAVAPRIVGDEDNSASVAARFSAAYSPLDLAERPARVTPGSRVSYVPTAVLLVRRSAIDAGFDTTLRYGEDVDFVWRLHDAGWRVRYDPSVHVRHPEPQVLSTLLARRFRYGTGAAPLAARHPDRLPPLVVAPWSAALMAAGLAGKPRATATIAAAQILPLARGLSAIGVPAHRAARWPLLGAGHTFLASGRAMAELLPALLVAGAVRQNTRRASLALLLCPPLVEWVRRKPPLDPVRWTALAIADDIAYGAGVWAGSVQARSFRSLIPRVVSRRSRSAMAQRQRRTGDCSRTANPRRSSPALRS